MIDNTVNDEIISKPILMYSTSLDISKRISEQKQFKNKILYLELSYYMHNINIFLLFWKYIHYMCYIDLLYKIFVVLSFPIQKC